MFWNLIKATRGHVFNVNFANVFNVKNPNMLVRVWQEMEYRFNVCRVTKGSHIEHL